MACRKVHDFSNAAWPPFLGSRGMGNEIVDTLDAIFNILTKGPTEIKRSRDELIQRLRRRKMG